MSQFIEFLESMVEHIMSMFVSSRDNLYRQIGTIEKVQKLVRAEKENNQKSTESPVKEKNEHSNSLNNRFEDIQAQLQGNVRQKQKKAQNRNLDDLER